MIDTNLTKRAEKNRIRGSLLGGAAGDALGYAVEFLGEREIFGKYGREGIREYRLDSARNKALISDDTQMTLFTAEALINYLKQSKESPRRNELLRYHAAAAYQDWLVTQERIFEGPKNPSGKSQKPLREIPEMYARRAPGLTCLSALETRKAQKASGKSFIKDKINNSKGCGGVMRVAPVGMMKCDNIEKLDMEGAEISAITHSHPLGYMPGAVLTHIIHRIICNDRQMTLHEIVKEARDMAAQLFGKCEHIGTLLGIMDLAAQLADNGEPDLDNIHRLGEGWTAEEALAIAVYCCLRYHDDFSRCIITAVNHKGDSDSTGAIAGNIIGAWLGYDETAEWEKDLELSDVILHVADTLSAELRE